jgi:hypothetical protein
VLTEQIFKRVQNWQDKYQGEGFVTVIHAPQPPRVRARLEQEKEKTKSEAVLLRVCGQGKWDNWASQKDGHLREQSYTCIEQLSNLCSSGLNGLPRNSLLDNRLI